MEERRRILIVLVAGIGDLVMASSSLRAFRNGYPESEIHLLTSVEAYPIALNYPYLDRVWAFPIRQLRTSYRHIFDIIKLLIDLRKIDFQKTINLFKVVSVSGALKMGLLFSLIKSRTKTGQGSRGFGLFLTDSLAGDLFSTNHTCAAMMDIAVSAGAIPDERGTEVFWDKHSESRWKSLFTDGHRSGQRVIIGINPGGDRRIRRWLPERYAFVADRLVEKFGARIFILGGPGEEQLSQRIRETMQHDAVDLAGKLSVGDLVYVVSRMDLLVTNDSGPMHIAAATGTPLVALFGPSDPRFSGPYTRDDHFRIVDKNIFCRPCTDYACRRTDCMNLITAEEVLGECIGLLETHHADLPK